MRNLLILMLVSALGMGCAQRREYELVVRNTTDQPLVLWLTKDGPPVEKGWKSPERIAIEYPGVDERIAELIVPPGRTASTGRVRGAFKPQTNAVLRIYAGDLTLSEILSTGGSHPGRLDLRVDPGRVEVVVGMDRGRLVTVDPPRRGTRGE